MPLPAGIPVAIPVPVPVSIAGSDRRSPHVTGRNINDEDVEGEGEEEGIVYTSRNGVIAGTALSATTPGSASGYVHAMNHPPPRNVSPRPQPRLPHSHAHSHSPHIPYPGVNKPKAASSTSLRHRIFAAAGGISYKRNERRRSVGRGEGETEGEGESEWETEGKVICTTPGMVCAGETETETDEPSRHLPTARLSRASRLSNSFSFSQSTSLTTLPWQWLLFEFSRLLAIVPASLGFVWCLWHIYTHVPNPDPDVVGVRRPIPDRIDYFIASLWALLTAHQCLSLTTGLLTRWRHYYAPLSTLVRLLALQGICWPATHLTVNILEVAKRPAVVWAVIGTTTCMSRSIQIWVVSNLPSNSASSQGISGGATDAREREKRRALEAEAASGAGGGAGGKKTVARGYGYIYWKKWNKWRRRRRWDWREVSLKCVLPAGVLYFVMAWAGEIRRELGGC